MHESDAYGQFGKPKPGKILAIAIMTIVSGAINIITALGLTVGIVLGTFGIGLLCTPLTILPGVLGIFEILWGVKLLANPAKPVQPSQVIPILEIACILFLNGVSLVVGILSLVFQNEPDVRQYFTEINAATPPEDQR